MTLTIPDVFFENIIYVNTTVSKNKPNDHFYLIKYTDKDSDFVIQSPFIEHIYEPSHLDGRHVIGNLEINLKNEKMYNFLKELEEKIMCDIKTDKYGWFNDRYTDINFKTLIRKRDDENYFKVRLIKNEKFETQIYDFTTMNVLEFSDLFLENNVVKHIQLLIEIYGIYISENEVSIILRPHKILVKKINIGKKKVHDFIAEVENIVIHEQEQIDEDTCSELIKTDTCKNNIVEFFRTDPRNVSKYADMHNQKEFEESSDEYEETNIIT